MEKTASRVYLGIDPALTSTGIAFVGDRFFDGFLIKPPPKTTGVLRLAYLRNRLHNALQVYSCTHCCIEGPSYGSINRADDIGQLRGVFLLTLHDLGIPTTIIAPKTLKKYATKSGDADKEKMIKTASIQWPNFKFKADTADAAWLGHISYALHEELPLRRSQLEVLKLITTPKLKKRIPRYGTDV